VDVIVTNPPFGGMEEDGIESNYPAEFRTRETADLFLVLLMKILKPGGRAGLVLPDGTLFGEGVKTRIKEALLTECNLHTIVRLPNGVFNPYTGIRTNLLFFTKGAPTTHVWYYEHPYPPGAKSYNKGKPIRIEEFEAERAWWGEEKDGFKSRVENEQAWRVSIDTIKAGNFNLDLKNPHNPDTGPGDVDHLLPEYEKLLAQIAATRAGRAHPTQKRQHPRQGIPALPSLKGTPQSQAPRMDPSGGGRVMKLETFFEKFDQFAEVPDAVAKMRELVLRLAFSGGLTGKRPSDDGVPEGWEIQTIESISQSISSGFACSRSHQVENGHVHLRTHNISTLGTLNFDLLVRIDQKMVDPQKASIRAGDILFNNTNSQELVGKTSLVDRDYDYGFSNHITRIRVKDGVYPGFVVFYLTLLRNSGYFAQLCTRWINQAAVNTDTLKEQKIPLPPLAEQKRIVAKVDELMALCDRLEAQQQERETRHAALARASLSRFADAPTPANLHFLFHKSYPIPPADLRKSILTLAVQGKLVPQDPNDEPAAEVRREDAAHGHSLC
jgi:hypothetical protein